MCMLSEKSGDVLLLLLHYLPEVLRVIIVLPLSSLLFFVLPSDGFLSIKSIFSAFFRHLQAVQRCLPSEVAYTIDTSVYSNGLRMVGWKKGILLKDDQRIYAYDTDWKECFSKPRGDYVPLYQSKRQQLRRVVCNTKDKGDQCNRLSQ